LFLVRKKLFDAVIFDMDGVIKQTAKTHAAVWKGMFDKYLQKLGSENSSEYRPFTIERDYHLYVDGKPEPDIFVHAARNLDVYPMRAVVVEDAIAGVRAARQGCFGCGIGVDSDNQAHALRENGADVTVRDLSEISVG
jgi:beta-phosphoglucomutase-like phosphatase (HAD superfamily)